MPGSLEVAIAHSQHCLPAYYSYHEVYDRSPILCDLFFFDGRDGSSFHPAIAINYSQRCAGTKDDGISTALMAHAGDPNKGLSLYPVISRIAGKNWIGSCKYIGADLIHLSKLKLTGGVRYDIDGRDVKLSSYLTFPNGKTREVVMTGSRDDTDNTVITLNPIEDGPIQMLLSEIAPDTILVNEVEIATGKTIMTCSTSITKGVYGEELVQVSHEVGDNGIEGHQVWRLTGAKNDAPLEVP